MKWFMCLMAVFVSWVLLFGSLSLEILGVGVFLALVIGTFLGGLYPDHMHRVLIIRRWFYLLIYLPYFLYYCIIANIDVAVRVIHPDVPIKPGIVKVRTTLTSDLAKTFLANSITLTPGTLTVDIDGQDFYVHWINIDTDSVEERTARICGRFEPLLRRIFE